jgi:glycosyltransferase involved in cell wall biosynthesis
MKKPSVSIIITAKDEFKSLHAIKGAKNVHKDTEVIIIVNGPKQTSSLIKKYVEARVISFEEPLNEGVCRAIGALHAKGDILLFLDSSLTVRSSLLRPYIEAIHSNKCDIAINCYHSKSPRKTMSQNNMYAYNETDFNPLNNNTLYPTPHAISRMAIEKIGVEHLAAPALALSIAIHKGLIINEISNLPVFNVKNSSYQKEESYLHSISQFLTYYNKSKHDLPPLAYPQLQIGLFKKFYMNREKTERINRVLHTLALEELGLTHVIYNIGKRISDSDVLHIDEMSRMVSREFQDGMKNEMVLQSVLNKFLSQS